MVLRRALHIGWRPLAAVLMAVLLAACEGSDSSPAASSAPPTSIASGTRVVSFAMLRVAGPISQDVNLVFEGTDVLAGFPPGVTAPTWLAITPGPVAANSASFTLTVNPVTLAPGRYETTVRFRAGNIPAGGTEADLAQTSEVDVPVRLNVVDLEVSPQLVSTNFIKGNGNLTGNITILSPNNLAWTVTSDQPWLTLDKSSGRGTDTVAYSIDPYVSGNGPHTGSAIIRHPASGEVFLATFNINVISPDLTLDPTALAFSLNAGSMPAQYSQQVTVTDRLNGRNAAVAASWSVSSIDVPWLEMSPASGSSAPAVTATVSVRADQIGSLGNGSHSGTITLAYTTEDGVAHTRTLPVTLNLAM